jgi:hypothetical protein
MAAKTVFRQLMIRFNLLAERKDPTMNAVQVRQSRTVQPTIPQGGALLAEKSGIPQARVPSGRFTVPNTVRAVLISVILVAVGCGGGSSTKETVPPTPPVGCSVSKQTVTAAQKEKFVAPRRAESASLLRTNAQADAAACLSVNDPTSATVKPITGDAAAHFKYLQNTPAACPSGYNCTFQDAEVDFNTQSGPITGFRYRYLRPTNIANPSLVPVLISVPGTGDCYVGDQAPTAMDMEATNNGAAVLEVAPRGHIACYFSGDALYHQADEFGPNTMADYDRLVTAFTRGWIDPTVHGDPAHVGIEGSSYGGVSSYIFGRQSCLPTITGKPLALVIGEAGSPDVSEWVTNGLDPADVPSVQAGTAPYATPWGSIKLDPGQQNEYPGALFDDPLRQDVLNDVNPAFWYGPDQFGWRSAHDNQNGTGTATFRQNVTHFLGVTGSQDCTVPHAGAMNFFADLVANGMTGARLISPIYLHGCHQPTTNDGFLPKPTHQNAQLITQWKENLEGGWIARYVAGVVPPAPLLDPGANNPTNQPTWLYMLGDEGILPTPPNVYSGPVPSLAQTSVPTLTIPGELSGQTLSYDPAGQGIEVDLKTPTWNEGARAQVCADFPVGNSDALVLGQPAVTVYGQESSKQQYSFTVVLEDVFSSSSCSGGTCIWPVGSDRRFQRANADASQVVDLDTMVHRFKAGHTMRVVFSNLAILSHAGDPNYPNGYPMYAPSTTPYTLQFSATDPVGSGDAANLKVPLLSGAPTLAPSTWQLR